MPLVVQIEQLKIIRCRRRELMLLDIDAANPIAFPLQSLDEVTADKSAGAANHRSLQRCPPPAEAALPARPGVRYQLHSDPNT